MPPRKPAVDKNIVHPAPAEQVAFRVDAPAGWMDQSAGGQAPLQGHPSNVLVAAAILKSYLRYLKVDSFGEMESRLAQMHPPTVNLLRGIIVQPWHFPIMDAFRQQIWQIKAVPAVNMVMCSACRKTSLYSGSSVPGKCALTRKCPGEPVKMPPVMKVDMLDGQPAPPKTKKTPPKEPTA